jgi:hypothetical protein
MARIRIALSFDLPDGATREEALAYAVDAVGSWKGQLRPPGGYSNLDAGDPMFGLERASVRGTIAVRRGKKRHIVRCEAE